MSPVRRQLPQNQVPEMRECPYPDCKEMIPREMFSCRRHWFMLPGDLRRDIAFQWQQYRGALRSGYLPRVAEEGEKLADVQSAAEAFWRVGT